MWMNRCCQGLRWRGTPSKVLSSCIDSISEMEPIFLEYKAVEENSCLLEISTFWRTKLSCVWDLRCSFVSAASLSFVNCPSVWFSCSCQSVNHIVTLSLPQGKAGDLTFKRIQITEISAKLGAGACDPIPLITVLLETPDGVWEKRLKGTKELNTRICFQYLLKPSKNTHVRTKGRERRCDNSSILQSEEQLMKQIRGRCPSKWWFRNKPLDGLKYSWNQLLSDAVEVVLKHRGSAGSLKVCSIPYPRPTSHAQTASALSEAIDLF